MFPSRRDRRISDHICASPNLPSSEIPPQLARLCILRAFFLSLDLEYRHPLDGQLRGSWSLYELQPEVQTA